MADKSNKWHHSTISGHRSHSQQKHQHQISRFYEQDDRASAPLPQSPPSYSVAMTELRRSDDQHITQSNVSL